MAVPDGFDRIVLSSDRAIDHEYDTRCHGRSVKKNSAILIIFEKIQTGKLP